MRSMRPHCVKYVVLLNCVSLCTHYNYMSSDERKMWLCVILTLVVLIMMCTNPYRMDGLH